MKKALLILLLCLVCVFGLFADEIIRYVDPDSAEGGDGTTWTLAYDSLFDWEATEEQDLTDGGGDWMHVYVRASGGTADTTAVDISGWTTGAANYILVEAASTDRASASGYDTNKYRLETGASTAITLNEDYLRFDGLQISHSDKSADNIRAFYNQSGSGYILISNSRGKGNDDPNWYDHFFYSTFATNAVDIYNCIIYDWGDSNTGEGAIYINTPSGSEIIRVLNNVVYNCYTGIDRSDGDWTVENNAVFQNNDDFDVAAGIDYNASDDGDGNNPVTPANWANVFENAAGGDFRLKSTDTDLHDSGTDDPGSGLYSDDIEGTTRVSTWDIGAFEYVAPAGGSIVPVSLDQGGRRRYVPMIWFLLMFNFVVSLCIGCAIYQMRTTLKNHNRRIQFFECEDTFNAWYELHGYLENKQVTKKG